jgi:hypothetical protein
MAKENLLLLRPKLNDEDHKLIADAMHDYSPGKDYSDVNVIALLPSDRVIAALRKFYMVYGTTAALTLACKLRRLRSRCKA